MFSIARHPDRELDQCPPRRDERLVVGRCTRERTHEQLHEPSRFDVELGERVRTVEDREHRERPTPQRDVEPAHRYRLLLEPTFVAARHHSRDARQDPIERRDIVASDLQRGLDHVTSRRPQRHTCARSDRRDVAVERIVTLGTDLVA